MKRGLVFVISAPAGTGKTTLVKMLKEEFHHIVGSVSYTTRLPRANEVEGRDYHFISTKAFEQKIKEDEFLEYAKVFDHYYGTSKKYVESQQEKGKHVILVIDTQGALQLMGRFDAIYIFMRPPSLEELMARLYRRKSEDEEAIRTRLSWAEREMALAPKYNYHIVNDNLKTAYDVLRSILIAEEHRNR
ncbi:MAG: guanylate kinase [Verrucomicrobia bacterium]|nr:guanylate kinase [Verrucomicrobiota bacterium]